LERYPAQVAFLVINIRESSKMDSSKKRLKDISENRKILVSKKSPLAR
jgi:hypothetical protein